MIIAIFALFVQPLVTLGIPAAFASTPVSNGSATIDKDHAYRSAPVDGSQYLDMTWSFDYDTSDLDASPTPDSLSYGWTVAGVDHVIGTMDGLAGSNNSAEIGFTAKQLPTGALADGLSVYAKVTANTSSDIVKLTNIKLEGTDKPVLLIDNEKPIINLVSLGVGGFNPDEFILEAHDETALAKVTANLYDSTNIVLLKSCSQDLNEIQDYILHCPVPVLADGVYTVRANARDEAGNISTTISRQFTIDHTSPKITVKTGDSFTEGASGVYRKVSFSLYDKYKVARYGIHDVVTNVTPNQYSDANFITVGSRGAQYGQNRITLYDLAGNSADYDFVLDNVAPELSIKSDSVGSEISKTFNRVSFKLHDTYKVDKIILNGATKDLSDNAWSDLNNVKPGVFGAKEGENTLLVYDIVGNVFTYTFTLDTKAPEGSFTYNPSNDIVKKGPVTVTLETTEPIESPEGWTIVNNTVFTRQFNDNGSFFLEIKDFAGNSSTLNYEVKGIDNVPPQPLVTGVARNSDGTYTITGTVTDNVKVGNVKVSINNSDFKSADVNGANWTFITTTLENGLYTVGVSSEDSVGNEGFAAPYKFTATTPVLPPALAELPGVSATTTRVTTSNTTNATPTTSPQTEQSEANDQAILGAQTTDKPAETLAVQATPKGWQIFGLAWYWWLLILAVLAGAIWWLIAARRRRSVEEV